jgi:hypothetical protein
MDGEITIVGILDSENAIHLIDSLKMTELST